MSDNSYNSALAKEAAEPPGFPAMPESPDIPPCQSSNRSAKPTVWPIDVRLQVGQSAN
jgi:hypothetical protein